MSNLTQSLDTMERFSAFTKAMEAVGANWCESYEARLYQGSEGLASAVLEM